jgi:hypothetical protein
VGQNWLSAVTLRQAQKRFQTGEACDPDDKALIWSMISPAILEAQALPH